MLLLLLVDKVLDVHVEAGGGDALRALGGLFTFLKQQRQEREKRVPVGTSRAHTCAHRDLLLAGLRSHPGTSPTLPSLLLPKSHPLRTSPLPAVSLDGSISCPSIEDPVSHSWGLRGFLFLPNGCLTFLFGQISCMDF